MHLNYIYMPVFDINMWKEEITNKTAYFISKHYSIKTNNNAIIKDFYLFSEQRWYKFLTVLFSLNMGYQKLQSKLTWDFEEWPCLGPLKINMEYKIMWINMTAVFSTIYIYVDNILFHC